jgi:outer membrane immunogenic protein
MRQIAFSLLAGTIVLGLASIASAADLPRKAPLPPPPPPCAQFGGFYVGGYVGGAHYDHGWTDRDAWGNELEVELNLGHVQVQKSGLIGGVQGGWNWQFRCTVFGVQADYGWSNIKARADFSDGEDMLDFLNVESKLLGVGTVRTRSGVVFDNLLLYVTGGFAWANFDRSYSLIDPGPPFETETFSSDKTKWGWTAGFGTEWAFWGNWSIQSEVLYARFEKDEKTFICSADIFCDGLAERKRFDHHDSVWISKIGLNYRFGGLFGKAPVVGRY